MDRDKQPQDLAASVPVEMVAAPINPSPGAIVIEQIAIVNKPESPETVIIDAPPKPMKPKPMKPNPQWTTRPPTQPPTLPPTLPPTIKPPTIKPPPVISSYNLHLIFYIQY